MKAKYYTNLLEYKDAINSQEDFEEVMAQPEGSIHQIRNTMDGLAYSTAVLFSGSGEAKLLYRMNLDDQITCCSVDNDSDRGIAA